MAGTEIVATTTQSPVSKPKATQSAEPKAPPITAGMTGTERKIFKAWEAHGVTGSRCGDGVNGGRVWKVEVEGEWIELSSSAREAIALAATWTKSVASIAA